MGVFEGRARVGKAMKELFLHWSEAKMSWSDATAKTFEQRHLAGLEMDARQAVGAMDTMAQKLQEIRRDCQ